MHITLSDIIFICKGMKEFNIVNKKSTEGGSMCKHLVVTRLPVAVSLGQPFEKMRNSYFLVADSPRRLIILIRRVARIDLRNTCITLDLRLCLFSLHHCLLPLYFKLFTNDEFKVNTISNFLLITTVIIVY